MSRVQHEEYLEQLWQIKESGEDQASIEALAARLDGEFDPHVIDHLDQQGLVDLSADRKRMVFTERGEEYARRIIRSHRLAERMLHDILRIRQGEIQFEAGACEFEHLVSPELIESICTLLGHPRECPHGKPIPEGECCRKSARLMECTPRPLTEFRVSDQARVAYVKCDRDDQIHRLDGLHIRPGILLKLHQTYPSFVIECEGTRIAMESKVASCIYVWRE